MCPNDGKRFVKRMRPYDPDAPGKWYFAASGVTDTQLMASGICVTSLPHVFFSRRSIASFRGKLLNLRDSVTPGRRIRSISVILYGETTPISLSFGNLEKEFRERVPFKKRKVYFVCLETDEPEFKMETE